MHEREHALSTQCWCRPVILSFSDEPAYDDHGQMVGMKRETRYPCATGEHRYHWSPVQAAACQAVAERLRETNNAPAV